MSVSPDIFDYENYRLFLRDWLGQSRSSYGFSYRTFSKRAGFKSPSVFKMVMDGQRNLTEASLNKFIKALQLTEMQGCFFRYLVLANQSADDADRARYVQWISVMKEARHRLPEIEAKIDRLRDEILNTIDRSFEWTFLRVQFG